MSGFSDMFDEEEALNRFFKEGRELPKKRGKRPTHYKVISISMYTEDLERLDALVAQLKELGHTRANKSMVIREALRQLDPAAIPPQR